MLKITSPDGFADGAERPAAERPAVAQDEQRFLHCHTMRPPTIVFHGRPVSAQPPKGVFRLFD